MSRHHLSAIATKNECFLITQKYENFYRMGERICKKLMENSC